ncbi:esterase family protein [Chitinophaga costaii]|nr:alpha/beta hydrolase family protein [Chitinophaga costaii]PUZ30353.1 esterase family protein [Chitinophaga costaii]
MKNILSTLLLCFVLLGAHAARLDTVLVPSAAMQKAVKCVVIAPTGTAKLKNLQVIYLLNGYSGNHSDYAKHMGAYLKQQADAHHWIFVCPDGNNSWYWDSPIDRSFRYETFISDELPAYVDAHYHTLANRSGRAIAGLSMGGHGALFNAIRHPNVFGAVGSMSGGVDFRPFPANWDIAKRLGALDTATHNWDAYTVQEQVSQLKNGELAIIFDCGVKDFFHTVNHNLHERLLALGIDHDYIERPGEHNWDYWNNSISFQLLFFQHYFDKASKP